MLKIENFLGLDFQNHIINFTLFPIFPKPCAKMKIQWKIWNLFKPLLIPSDFQDFCIYLAKLQPFGILSNEKSAEIVVNIEHQSSKIY